MLAVNKLKMNRTQHIFTFLFFLTTILNSTGCIIGKNKDQNISLKSSIILDSNFSFTYKDDLDTYNLTTNTFTRFYNSGVRSFICSPKQWQIDKIQRYYLILSLDTLPLNYDPKCFVNIEPSNYIEITVDYFGKKKSIIYNHHCQCKESDSRVLVERIKLFVKLVEQTIFNLDCSTDIPRSDFKKM